MADPNQQKSTASSHDEHMGISFNETRLHDPEEGVGLKKASVDPHPHMDTKNSHLADNQPAFDVGRAFNDDHVEAGTIVSDRRKHRASLKENLFSAFSEMLGNAKGKVTSGVGEITKITEKRKVEAPVIQKAETRASIVKEAATYSTIAQKNDHKVAIEKSRTFKQDVERATGTPFTVKPEESKARTWTHTKGVEPSKVDTAPQKKVLPDLRGSMVAPVVSTRINTDIKTFTPPKRVEPTRPSLPPTPAKPVSQASLPKFHVPSMVPKKEVHLQSAVQVAPAVRPEAKAQISFPPLPNIPRKDTESIPMVAEKPKVIPPAPQPAQPRVAPSVPPSLIMANAPRKDAAPVVPNVFRTPPAPPTPPPTFVPPPMPKPVPPPLPPQPIPAPIAQPLRRETPIATSSPVLKYTPPAAAKKGDGRMFRTIIRWVILLGIALIGIALAIALVMYLNTRAGSPVVEEGTITIPAFFETNAQMAVPFEGRDAFLTTLSSHVGTAASGVVQFYPTLTDGNGRRAMTAEELFGSLGVSLSFKTQRALDEHLMLGSITTTKNEPFIIIRSYNFDVLFAGMLEWEGTLYTDFAPFLGAGYTGPMTFTDAIQNNKSIRILRDAEGNEILLYSFINQNTVVITTSSAALSEILTRF